MSEQEFELQTLARKIIRYKEERNMTYQDLEREWDIDKSYLHRIANANSSPSFAALIKLSKAMELPLYTLFLPDDSYISQVLAEQIENKLTELKMTKEDLAEKTGILYLRLIDILEGDNLPTAEENLKLREFLELEEMHDYSADKMNLLKSILETTNMSKDKISRILDYIETNSK